MSNRPARFIDFGYVRKLISGRVAIVGSGPSCLDNEPGFVDGHDLVVRVNNYKTGAAQGSRCDIHYSFYGGSIRKTADELRGDGVWLCLCKLPDSQPIESEWHRKNAKMAGIDYRYIYAARKDWWFTDTFVPDDAHFMRKFELLGKHQPTTGFAAILDLLACDPASVYLTGFDGFTSGIHNVNEPWRSKNSDDPIRHRPDLELDWLAENAARYPLRFDAVLAGLLEARKVAA